MKVSSECLRAHDFININRPNRSFFVFFNNMYTEEEASGAMMWCVPTTSVQKSNTCPSGYSLKDNKCIKTESVSCTTN